ncbi:MAG TPA: hypothetical protein VFA95_04665 [Gammaproteobacteria bacterium]|nr:hypothetical protein [Gammaproteobacteria bacterium]
MGEDFSAAALATRATGRMPAFWVPRYRRLVGTLPRTPSGRIRKYRLRPDGVTPDTLDLGLASRVGASRPDRGRRRWHGPR